MSFIALLLAFSSIEQFLLTYGSGLRLIGLFTQKVGWQRHLIIFGYLFLAGLGGWVLGLAADRLGLPFLTTVAYPLAAYFLPLGLQRLIGLWTVIVPDGRPGTDYSISAGIVVMFVVHKYHLSFYEALLASLVGAAGYLLIGLLFRQILHKLSFEAIPARFQGLPLSLIVLGLIGLVCLGLDAALLPAFWVVFRS